MTTLVSITNIVIHSPSIIYFQKIFNRRTSLSEIRITTLVGITNIAIYSPFIIYFQKNI